MADSIPHLRREVQTAVDALLHAAEEPRSRRFFEFESELWTGLLALGCAVVRLFLECQVARPRPVEYRAGGQRYRLTGERQTLELGTRFGKVSFARPVGRRPEAPRAACDVPVDRELGLCSGFSLGVVQGLLRLYAQMAYGTARSTFRDSYEWVPSPRAALRMVDAVGTRARPFLEQAALPEDDGEILVLQVDGRGAPMIGVSELARRCQPHLPREEGTTARQRRRQRRQSRTKPRRTKGEPSKNAKVAIVGVPSSWLTGVTISGVFRRCTSPTQKSVSTGITSSNTSGARENVDIPRAQPNCGPGLDTRHGCSSAARPRPCSLSCSGCAPRSRRQVQEPRASESGWTTPSASTATTARA